MERRLVVRRGDFVVTKFVRPPRPVSAIAPSPIGRSLGRNDPTRYHFPDH